MLYFHETILNKLSKEDVTLNEAKNLSIKKLKLCREDREFVTENKDGVFAIVNLTEVKKAILKEQLKLPKIFSTKKA